MPVCPALFRWGCFWRGASIQALATVGSLLGVEEAVLEKMLTQRVVKTRGEVFEKKLEVQDANLTRNAIVKSLYEVGGWEGWADRVGRHFFTGRVFPFRGGFVFRPSPPSTQKYLRTCVRRQDRSCEKETDFASKLPLEGSR